MGMIYLFLLVRFFQSGYSKETASSQAELHLLHNLIQDVGVMESGQECVKCDRLQPSPVCGFNGKTYPTLCHAVHCASLLSTDVSSGECISENVCAAASCGPGEVCEPLNRRGCLAHYASSRTQKIPCRKYKCVSVEKECSNEGQYAVCGEDGKTYPSMCALLTSGVSMAYVGQCRPSQCWIPVCGVDMNTYPSTCHASSRNVAVSHAGRCFQTIHADPKLSYCSKVLMSGMCRQVQCKHPVIPQDQCCPICGGSAVFWLNTTIMSQWIMQNEELDHLKMIEALLESQLPVHGKCHFYTYLTNDGAVAAVLDAINFKDHELCLKAMTTLKYDAMERKFEIRYNKITQWIIKKARELFNFGHKGNSSNSTQSSGSVSYYVHYYMPSVMLGLLIALLP